jgi:hypothetical protein
VLAISKLSDQSDAAYLQSSTNYDDGIEPSRTQALHLLILQLVVIRIAMRRRCEQQRGRHHHNADL